MTAKEFFETQTITDANSVINKNAEKYSRFDLIKFAEAYYNAKIREEEKHKYEKQNKNGTKN